MSQPSSPSTDTATDDLVPDSVIPRGKLPPLKYRDLPEPVPLRRMIGPGIILAGLALGSGEFILWPYITFKSQFVFFWACMLGVTTQYFLNMEITRWTLATGESAITGFCRMSRHFAWLFLLMNVIPHVIPAWSKGAAQLVSWLIWGGPQVIDGELITRFETPLAIGGMILCGAILTAGPVIYETVEKIQMFLVSAIILIVVVLAVWLLKDRPDAIVAQVTAVATLGAPDFVPELDEQLTVAALLGALAFAGAGGTLNLCQSNYVKDKGFGMGRYIGRITSPITGQEEAITETGYHFRETPENTVRWRRWWRNANLEHFSSFFLTCLVSLVLLSLISYVLFYDRTGRLHEGAQQYKAGIGFVWGEAQHLEQKLVSPAAKVMFLVMGVAILLTTEFGVLDAASRVSTDTVKVAWLRESGTWTESRLYYLFLWLSIAVGTVILLLGEDAVKGSFLLFKMASALNGAVMFCYSMTLLYLNRRMLPPPVRMNRWRQAIMVWSVLFFGFFTAWVGWSQIAGLL